MNGSYFDEDNELTIKVVIIGNGAVGKSSLIQRYCRGIFTNQYKKTIGVDFLERTIDVNTQKIRLFLWDTAGQEEFDALTSAYYRGAHACIIAFSTTDRESFNSVSSWYKKIEYNCGLIPTILVQSKIDLLAQNATVNRDEVNELSAKLRLPLFLTSSKENLNIENAFYFLAKSYLDSLNVIDSPVINKNLNHFLANKPPNQQTHRKLALRSINNEQNIRLNGNLYKSNLKNCWPAANALLLNNNNHENTTGKPKLVIGRNSNQSQTNHYLPKLLPVPMNSNQTYYNRNLNKSLNPTANCHYLTAQSNFLNPSSNYLTMSHHQNKGRYFLLHNSNAINLSDNMFYTCYNNEYNLKDYTTKKSKFSIKNGLFSKCRII